MNAITAHGSWIWSARPAGRPTHGAARLRRTARAGPVLEPHERVLIEAGRRGGGIAVGTDRALIVSGPDGRWRRLEWADIAEAAWSPVTASTVIQLWPVGNDLPERIAFPTERRFAALTVDRVAAAQVLRRRVQLTETVAATVLASRTPDREEVTWRVLLDAGHIEDDPHLALAARRAVAELHGLAGC